MRPVCTVEGCEKPMRYTGRGLCIMHYHRVRRGLPLDYQPRTNCKECGVVLENPHPLRFMCEDCALKRKRQQCRDYYHQHSEKERQRAKERGVERKYGIPFAEYEELMAGSCAICGTPATEKKLHMDHDHATGANRDALCGGCNVGLGAFGDDPERLEAAASYLRLHRERNPIDHAKEIEGLAI